MNTLYEELGGEAAVDAAVDRFYDKVLADPSIAHFFKGVDMKRQAMHQKMFLTYAFGGLPHYSGKNMRTAHQHLVEKMGLDDSHFDAVLTHLGQTLKELNVAPELIQKAAAVAESTRNDVLNR